MSKLTDLENKQIDNLCHATKSKIKSVKIKNIIDTINVMVNEAYHNKEVNNIYNKKHIIIESLKEMHRSDDNTMNYHNHKIIDTYDNIINQKINNEEFKKNKKRNSCKCF